MQTKEKQRVSDIQSSFLRRKRGSYKNTLLRDGFSKCANHTFGKCTKSSELRLFGVVICMFVRTLLETMAIIFCVKVLNIYEILSKIILF
jgi:hypothetical protein